MDRFLNNFKFFKGFTLAETLVTLAIIGVVASMTVPNLMASYQKTQFKSALRKAHTTLTHAIKLIERENGEVEALFFRDNLKDYLKHYEEFKYTQYNVNKIYKRLNNNNYVNWTLYDDYLLKHPDGSILFLNTDNYTFPVQIYVDTNGFKKGPNKFGYDMFLVIEYGKDRKFRIMGAPETTYKDQNKYCNLKSSDDKNGMGCAYRALFDIKYWDELPRK